MKRKLIIDLPKSEIFVINHDKFLSRLHESDTDIVTDFGEKKI